MAKRIAIIGGSIVGNGPRNQVSYFGAGVEIGEERLEMGRLGIMNREL